MQQEWSFTIKASSAEELRDQLTTAASYVRMFPALFEKSEVDTQLEITEQCEANRCE